MPNETSSLLPLLLSNNIPLSRPKVVGPSCHDAMRLTAECFLPSSDVQPFPTKRSLSFNLPMGGMSKTGSTIGDEKATRTVKPPSRCDLTCDCPGNCSSRNQLISRIEVARVAKLKSLHIMDTAPEEPYERIVHLAVQLFKAPMCGICFIDDQRLWVKAKKGIDFCEAPRENTICQFVLRSDDPFVVLDASKHPLLSSYPGVQGPPHVRFYAATPLVTREGFRIGSLFIADSKSWPIFTHQQQEDLISLSKTVVQQLEMGLLQRYSLNRTTGLRRLLPLSPAAV